MKMLWPASLLFAITVTSMIPSDATACVTKSGKDCDAAAAHKVFYTKKLIKLAPAGGVGKKTHSTGFDALGTQSFSAAPTAPPDQQQNFGTNPDGWFYLMPLSTDAGGFVGRPMPHRILSLLSANAERGGAGPLIHPDGSLTQHAVDIGWARTGSAVPFAVTQSAPTTSQSQPATPQYQPPVPQQVQTPSPTIAAPTPNVVIAPQYQPPVPQQVQASQQSVPVPLPNAVIAPTLLPGHAANGPARAHPDQHVDVYHPTKAGVYSYSDAHKIGDPSFHLVVVGFKEPE